MLHIELIAVGKLKEKYFIDGCNEYIKRLGGLCKFTATTVDEFRLSDNPTKAEIANALNSEAKSIIAKLAKSTVIIPLCIEGKQLSSEELSKTLSDFALNAKGHITFIIGSSYGISDDIKSRAEIKLSMSKMTFPHRLARLMLLEQIYRALSINYGTKYHK